MRIHSNVIEYADVIEAVHGMPGVYVTVSQHGSRSHARAFEVMLEGNGAARNTGTHGGDPQIQAATWDEWGLFLARLYDLDNSMLCGSAKYPVYASLSDFDYHTQGRFSELEMPADTHRRHTWDYVGVRRQRCKKCSAERAFK